MHIEIQPFAEEHVAGAAQLERSCFAAPWSAQALREELDNPYALFLAAVSQPSGATVGYLGCHLILGEGYIANVAVDPNCRRAGIGGLLVAELIAQAAQRGASFLTLEVRASNRPAIALYQKYGFSPVGSRPRFYEKPREDALLMTVRFDGAEGSEQYENISH